MSRMRPLATARWGPTAPGGAPAATPPARTASACRDPAVISSANEHVFIPGTFLKEEPAMEPTKQPIPREAIDAYNLFIHGNIDRRAFLDRVKKVAVSSAAAAAIVDQLMPNYAAAQQVSPTDPRIKTERATVPSPNGNGKITGLLVRPANAGTNRLPAILVIHENR